MAGGREFLAALDRGVAEWVATADRELDRTADFVVSRAQAHAPVDTGELKASIRKMGTERDVVSTSIDVGTDDAVGTYQEFGTSSMPPHPFMRPALAEAPGQFGRSL